MLNRRTTPGAAVSLLVAFAALSVATAWPGVMTWDAAREYGMALGGAIDDWHPPVMIWLWRQTLHLAAGPGPMLLLQQALYWSGFALLGHRAWRDGRGGLAIALAAASLFPIALALEGALLKDCLMAGALLVALALLAPATPGRAARLTAAAFLLFAATLRFNALFACLPLLVGTLPASWRVTRARLAGATLGAVLALAMVTPLASRAIGARPSHVELSQILFDVGGISYYSGTDAFPPVANIADPVAVNRRCYHPELWDSYAWWTDTPCPIGWAKAGAALQARGAIRWWLGQIARHPIAYAEHRLRHFAANTRVVALAGPDAVIPPQPDPNPYGFAPPANPPRRAIDAAAAWVARTPLGRPICWIALAAALLAFAPTLRARRPVALAASSALLFGLSYGVMSVASDLRYHLWTMLATLVAAMLAAADLATRWRERRRGGARTIVTA